MPSKGIASTLRNGTLSWDTRMAMEGSMIFILCMHFTQVSMSRDGPRMAMSAFSAASSSMEDAGLAKAHRLKPFAVTFSANPAATAGSESYMRMVKG
jgi:hypothetical protein